MPGNASRLRDQRSRCRPSGTLAKSRNPLQAASGWIRRVILGILGAVPLKESKGRSRMTIAQPTRHLPHQKAPLKALPAKLSPLRIKPGREERYTPDQILTALRHARGMVTAAARVLGCNRQVIYNYKAKYPQIDEVLAEAREQQLDMTELALFRAIDQGEAWAIKLYLKTHGRSRGYSEKQDTGQGTMTLEELVLLSQQKEAPGTLTKGFVRSKP